MIRRFLAGAAPLVLALVLAPTAGSGQAHDAHADHHAGDEPAAVLSETAQEQVRRVEASVAQFDAPAAARRAGFRPALGLIPTMGTHWVNASRMRSGSGTDLDRPEHLMFAPIDGRETLVGVAFAYNARPGTAEPDLFDGELDSWHAHPELSPPGQELTMLHVWFVPSPDGPFAGHNPWLPYFAVGLEPPDPSRLAVDEDSYRIRALGLALAETVQPFSASPLLGLASRSDDSDARRDRIRALVPVLDDAASRGDVDAWNDAADEAVEAWEEIRASYLEALGPGPVRERIDEFYDEMLTGHHGDHGDTDPHDHH